MAGFRPPDHEGFLFFFAIWKLQRKNNISGYLLIKQVYGPHCYFTLSMIITMRDRPEATKKYLTKK